MNAQDLSTRATSIQGCAVALLGGTAGVGLETACRFAERGARAVALLGRDPDRGEGACEVVRARASSTTVRFLPVDGRDPDAVTEAARSLHEQFGSIDVLVTSTGPSKPPRLMHTIPIDDVQPTLDGIVLPPLLMMHAVLPLMCRQRSGAVVNVASDAAKIATPGETIIGAAMAAIVMFSRAAALEAKREGVRINVITPSLIANTPGSAWIASDPFAARLFEKAASLAHLGVAEPEDLAAMILFLATPAARRITGQAISINGGISVA
jgi:NAD(P)-dependent dehydrogenase (short-subunit alcohol dehydrogenase family)